MRVPRMVVALLLVAPGAVLTACTSSPSNSGAGPCLVDSTCDDPAQFGKGPTVVERARRGGTVTVLTHHGLDGTLDPTYASDPATVSILSGLVTRSLTEERYDPQTKQMELVPDIATDLGVHNEDYTEWKYNVRPGVAFEDGTDVTAADVARGIRRCLQARAFPTSPCLRSGLVRLGVHRRTLTFRFARPFPDLPYLASLPAFGPVPPGTTPRDERYAGHPTSTGPYEVQGYRRGRRLVLVRNAHWDARTDPGRTQYPDRYVIRAGVPDPRIERLLVGDQGSAQTTLTLDALDPTPFSRSDTARSRLVLGGSPCTTYLAPDNRTITDPLVRRALIWAYPYRAVLRAEGLVRGVTAVPATNLVPPGVPGRTALTVPHHRGFATQPRVARRILTEAHAVGTPLRFSYEPSDATSRRVRDALVRSLRASGFRPRPRGAPAPSTDLRTTTRCGAWPSGDQWLEPAYRPVLPGPTYDVEHFAQPSVTRRMDDIVRQPLDRQYESWNRLDRGVLRRWQPVVPLWYSGVSMAHGSRIRGMADDSLLGMPTWGRIWVAPAT